MKVAKRIEKLNDRKAAKKLDSENKTSAFIINYLKNCQIDGLNFTPIIKAYETGKSDGERSLFFQAAYEMARNAYFNWTECEHFKNALTKEDIASFTDKKFVFIREYLDERNDALSDDCNFKRVNNEIILNTILAEAQSVFSICPSEIIQIKDALKSRQLAEDEESYKENLSDFLNAVFKKDQIKLSVLLEKKLKIATKINRKEKYQRNKVIA